MIYLLDTNAVSDLMRENSPVQQWLSKLEPEAQVVICPIVRVRSCMEWGGCRKVDSARR